MQFRKRRCLLNISLVSLFYIFWRLTSPVKYDDDKTALSALKPQHFAEDSRKGILYHHKTHDGIESYQTANDSWVRTIMVPFNDEKSIASNIPLEVPWSNAQNWSTGRQLHPLYSRDIARLLRRMVTARVLKADAYPRGTQLKLSLTLEGGQEVVFKPKRYDKDFVLLGSPYVGRDRHFAEIAGFYLSRLLLFARTPLVVGVRLDFLRELLPVMTPKLNATVFTKDERFCFYGVCHYCTGPEYGACSDDGFIEGAMLLHLDKSAKLYRHPHPWRRTYREGVQAEWEKEPRKFCQQLMQKEPELFQGPRLADLMDTAVHDYLIGNADRHHYETLGNKLDSVVVLLDNGKAFGNPYLDVPSILAPLNQCCILRWSTWKRLQELSNGVLSAAMERLMKDDPLNPVLTKLHLTAMDRRLRFVLSSVHRCIERNGHSNVLIGDKPP